MKIQKKQKQVSLLLGNFLLLCVLLTGCLGGTKNDAQVQEAFDAYLETIFIDEVQTDGISFNYTLSHPEAYGITSAPTSLGEYGVEAANENFAKAENYLSSLKDFPYKKLTKEQQLTYDILKDNLTQELEGEKYLFYQNSLSKTIGLQAQLPVLFAEYTFTDQSSVDTYLALLADIERYYGQILTFEEQKIEQGLFMSHATAADIITQCKNFISKTDNNLLIEVFNDKIEAVEGLTAKEKKDYQEKNREIVLQSVIPAYKNIISFLTQHLDSGVNSGGLCYYPEGKEYYQFLVTNSTGSSKTIKEIDEALNERLSSSMKVMQEIATEDTSILDKAMNVSYPMTDPAEILSYLEEAILADYPAVDEVNYSIKYVHESLQPDISPAFYLTPPLDEPDRNVVYINPYKDYNMDTIFTTLAHEGYPGHLYQTVYFSQTKPAPIRSLLGCTGYSEGWATYVEMDSYLISGIDKTLAKFLAANNVASLCMYGKVDVGVNYYGWDLEKTTSYLSQFGLSDTAAIKEIYQAMVAEPGNYLNYILGYIEFMEMREMAQKKLGDDFVLKDFHELILSIGPANFDILNERLKDSL